MKSGKSRIHHETVETGLGWNGVSERTIHALQGEMRGNTGRC